MDTGAPNEPPSDEGNEEWLCGHQVAQAAKERHECATIPLQCLGEVLHLQLLMGMEAEWHRQNTQWKRSRLPSSTGRLNS